MINKSSSKSKDFVPEKSNPRPPVRFEQALKFTLEWEGGWCAHPSDVGGETNFGITSTVYHDYRALKNLPRQSVKEITDSEVYDIYRRQYWNSAHCDLMCPPLAIVMFDTAVNFGATGAFMFLQEALRLPMNGVFDALTKNTLLSNNTQQTAQKYLDKRIAYRYQRIREAPSQSPFLPGWINRDRALENFIAKL
ncbi:MAG TPA: glycosyl hydrolase 108 family protein [Candidatus Caenarcaniphilales bacterium]